jgi:hypothetical protein
MVSVLPECDVDATVYVPSTSGVEDPDTTNVPPTGKDPEYSLSASEISNSFDACDPPVTVYWVEISTQASVDVLYRYCLFVVTPIK